jgi:hypothetical protein
MRQNLKVPELLQNASLNRDYSESKTKRSGVFSDDSERTTRIEEKSIVLYHNSDMRLSVTNSSEPNFPS